ncbi:MAG: hypothetical protein IPK80_35720 [Nannocystis sp.]|nr:hypothetical protein [Nannocystis sp.]
MPRGSAGISGFVGAALVAAAAAAAILGAQARTRRWPEARRSAAELASMTPARRGDGFVGSGACAACHPSEHRSWAGSFHRTMTQLATPAAALAPFAGETLRGVDGEYRAFRRGEELWVAMVDPEWKRARARGGDALVAGPVIERRVVMTTGSHHLQVYWVATATGEELLAFPFTYLIEDGRWAPNESTLLRPPGGDAVYTWNQVCIQCHAVAGVPGYDEGGAAASRTAELGIACEACHGPGAAHVAANQAPWRRYARHLADGTDPSIVNPARLDPRRASEVCGLCHSAAVFADEARWLREGAAFRAGDRLEPEHGLLRHPLLADQPWVDALLAADPGLIDGRLWPDGTIRVAGRELTGMIESGCYQRGELSCLSCHQLHGADPDDQLARGMDGDGACAGCHAAIAAAPAEHSRHPRGSAGSGCLECHMPRTTYGLLGAIRSHRIDSPELSAGAEGRPNACNLCHLDKSLGWTAQRLVEWFGQAPAGLDEEEQTIAAGVLWALRGDANQRALAAWHLGWAPAQAASGADWQGLLLAPLMEDPYDAVRYIAGRSARALPGSEALRFDYVGPPAARAAAAARVRTIAEVGLARRRGDAALLVDEAGSVDAAAVRRLMQRRNDRPIDLRE